jgi:hypothetical protein
MNEGAGGEDERLRILSPALKSPSPLNVQPWYVTFPAPRRIDLFIDPTRLLPKLDPSCHQILLSFGAFIENLDISSRENGFRTDITYFPAGWPGELPDPEQPVARIDLTPDSRVNKDPLFPVILQRQSNRGLYKSQPIPDSLMGRLTDSVGVDLMPMAMGYTVHPGLMNDICRFLIMSMEIELADNERVGEVARWISCKTPSTRNSDGLSLSQLGMTGLAGWFSRFIFCLSEKQMRPSFLRHVLVSQTRKQATSAVAFGWIVTPENHKVTQLRAGRAFERVHLTATFLSLSLQPMNHILHTYADMENTRRDFRATLGIPETGTLQMIFRMGYARPAPFAPRRQPESIVK